MTLASAKSMATEATSDNCDAAVWTVSLRSRSRVPMRSVSRRFHRLSRFSPSAGSSIAENADTSSSS